jgi:hypothetical protein
MGKKTRNWSELNSKVAPSTEKCWRKKIKRKYSAPRAESSHGGQAPFSGEAFIGFALERPPGYFLSLKRRP